MRRSTALMLGVSGVALAVTAGSAFTATGLTNTAGDSQFIGGTVSQTVTGATLSGVTYTFADTTNTAVTKILLTFADGNADGKTPTVALTGGDTDTFTCAAIDTSGGVTSSECTTSGSGSYTGLTSLAVTVPS